MILASTRSMKNLNNPKGLISHSLMITILALLLQGCEGFEDTEEDGDEDIVVFSTDDGTTTITNDDIYEFILRADDSYVTLEDNISEITIQGNGNYLTIDSDTSIDEISITGDDNIITVDDDVNLTVSQLNIVGNGNTVTVYDITTYSETSDADQSNNLACEISVGSCL